MDIAERVMINARGKHLRYKHHSAYTEEYNKLHVQRKRHNKGIFF